VSVSKGSVPPPSGIPSGDEHSFAVAEDGTRLFVETRSAGHLDTVPTAFFCDGILCDGFIWKYLYAEISKVLRVAHWHYRGHGRSGAPVDKERIDIAAHAADLHAVREKVGDPPCVILGHSMGTQVALEEYHRYPDRVRGLVLLCGSFGKVTQTFRGMPVLDFILPKLMDIVEKQPDLVRALWSRIPPEVALKLALRARDVDPDKVHADDMLPYLKHMTHVDFPMFLKMLRAAGDHTAEEYLGSIDVPVLVVAGEKDTFTPAALSTFMAEAIPKAELLMVPGGTHVAPIEQPELVSKRILEFIRDRVLA
jgi:pimeloyl-ACP methyl ester carboxylesterase